MGSLRDTDLAAALKFTLVANAFDSADSFRAGILPELRRLISVDTASYNDLDLAAGRSFVAIDPPDANFPGMAELFAATAHQHPGVICAQRGDRRPHLISDFLSERELHRLDLYGEVLRPVETEDQLYVNLIPPTRVTIALNRSRRSFTARDRELIELLQPHLTQAWQQAQLRDHTNALIQAQDAGLRENDAALILLDPAGAVVHASALARHLLGTFFSDRHTISGVLPESLANWLGASNPDLPKNLTIITTQGRLHVRALAGRSARGWRALLLSEEKSGIPDADTLRGLGLTDRQAEVLALLARGLNTQGIADALYLSPGTVRKHLEHIYARLGVQSRTEAVALAVRQVPCPSVGRRG